VAETTPHQRDYRKFMHVTKRTEALMIAAISTVTSTNGVLMENIVSYPIQYSGPAQSELGI